MWRDARDYSHVTSRAVRLKIHKAQKEQPSWTLSVFFLVLVACSCGLSMLSQLYIMSW